MLMSLKWLGDFVEVKEFFTKPESLAEILTKAGLEVETVIDKSKDFNHVVIGLILEKIQHPNADRLSLCRVTTGEGVVHQIVCGAQNHKANDRVVLALPGATLPGNFAIGKSVIRGVESGGMLCSDEELGLPEETEGIRLLPEDAPIGKSFAEYEGFDDVIFELKVTPNRADCLSHYGLAREVACLLKRPLKEIHSRFEVSSNSTQKEIALEVRASELCARYAGRYFSQVKVGPSPGWMKKRLELIGLNSINNVVDVTNYVMMEMGQPLHAFDGKELLGKKIFVEMAKAGETFQTLDGTALTLSGEELMIRDADRSLAMAGVVGGKNSGISDGTTEIFLEAAYFAPMVARRSSRTYKLNTDSSYRFSRGVDPNNVLKALDRATELLLQVAGGAAYSEPYDFYPAPMKKVPVEVTVDTISQRLGLSAEAEKFVDFMQRLGCVVEPKEGGVFQVTPPTFRFDLEQEMDLVEEYARLHGYEHISDTLPLTKVKPTSHDFLFLRHHRVAGLLAAQGLYQAVNLAFTSEKKENDFLGGNREGLKETGLFIPPNPIRVLNPLSEDLSVLKTFLAYHLFCNVTYNFHQGNEVGGLFEIGKCFRSALSSESPEYQEDWRLGLIQWGYRPQLWSKEPSYPLVFELKSKIETLLELFSIKSFQWMNGSPAPAFLHQGQWSILQVDGHRRGFLGTIHPSLLDENKIRTSVVLAELDLEGILAGSLRSRRYEGLSRQPMIQRDLALLMKQDIPSGEVEQELRKFAGDLLKTVEVFDVYEKDLLEKGQKSVAYRLRFQDKVSTLHDNVINELMEKVIIRLEQKFGLSVR